MDANVMDTEKKVYNTPELIEHGNLIAITQNGCYDGIGDTFIGQEDLFTSETCG